jgi:hypothetical protein
MINVIRIDGEKLAVEELAVEGRAENNFPGK